MRGKFADLTGQRFGRLTVVERAGRDNNGSIKWKCLCDCGNKTIVSSCNLISKGTSSCGCYHKEIQPEITKKRNEYQCKDNTILCTLTSKKSSANTSGIKGVCWHKLNQKWMATIGFKRKTIFLGYFNNIEDAAKARALAEEEYFQPILDRYEVKTNESVQP